MRKSRKVKAVRRVFGQVNATAEKLALQRDADGTPASGYLWRTRAALRLARRHLTNAIESLK